MKHIIVASCFTGGYIIDMFFNEFFFTVEDHEYIYKKTNITELQAENYYNSNQTFKDFCKNNTELYDETIKEIERNNKKFFELKREELILTKKKLDENIEKCENIINEINK